MDTRLQELTDKIYQEGVEKGNEEAAKIVQSAKDEAAQLIAKAQKEAEQIVADAKKASEELAKNTQSELQITGKQMVDAVKQEIAAIVNNEIATSSVKPAVTDPKFIQEMVKAALGNWAKDNDVKVVISEKDEAGIEKFITSSLKGMFDKGITIEKVNGVTAGFQVGPADGSYKVSFTDEDFVAFFKDYIRPRLAKLLFA